MFQALLSRLSFSPLKASTADTVTHENEKEKNYLNEQSVHEVASKENVPKHNKTKETKQTAKGGMVSAVKNTGQSVSATAKRQTVLSLQPFTPQPVIAFAHLPLMTLKRKALLVDTTYFKDHEFVHLEISISGTSVSVEEEIRLLNDRGEVVFTSSNAPTMADKLAKSQGQKIQLKLAAGRLISFEVEWVIYKTKEVKERRCLNFKVRETGVKVSCVLLASLELNETRSKIEDFASNSILKRKASDTKLVTRKKSTAVTGEGGSDNVKPRVPLRRAATTSRLKLHSTSKDSEIVNKSTASLCTENGDQDEYMKSWLNYELLAHQTISLSSSLNASKYEKYTEILKMNRLLGYAVKGVYKSEPFQVVYNKLYEELFVKKKLNVKAPTEGVDVFNDVGIKVKLLFHYEKGGLLCGCYNDQYLKLAALTMLSVKYPSQFSWNEYDTSRDLLQVLFFSSQDTEDQSRVVFELLVLILLLDKVFMTRLIPHAGLFQLQKVSSKDILYKISSMMLKGEGDIGRHLANIGYSLSSVSQSSVEFYNANDYDFEVKNLSTDLRDGVRLCKLVDLLSPPNEKQEPLMSRVSLAGTAAASAKNLDLVIQRVFPTSSREKRFIVEGVSKGHREVTLNLLWNIMYKFTLNQLFSEGETESQTLKTVCMDLSKNLGASLDDIESNETDDHLMFLMKWVRLSLGKIEGSFSWNDFATNPEFLVQIVNTYMPSVVKEVEHEFEFLKPSTIVKQEPSDNDNISWIPLNIPSEEEIEAKYRFQNILYNMTVFNECLVKLGNVPVLVSTNSVRKAVDARDSETINNLLLTDKYVIITLAYLSNRIIYLREEMDAAAKIQKCFRQHRLAKQAKAQMTISRFYKRYIKEKVLWRQKVEVIREVQAVCKGYLVRRRTEELKKSIVVIQSFARMLIAKAAFRTFKVSLISVQSIIRGRAVRKLVRAQRDKIIQQQALIRGFLCRRKTKVLKDTLVSLSAQARGYLIRLKLQRVTKAATLIQAAWRSHFLRDKYLSERKLIVRAQSVCRMYLAQKQYNAARMLIVNTQSVARGFLVRKSMQSSRKNLINVQSICRGYLVRQRLLASLISIKFLQASARGFLVRRQVAQSVFSITKAQSITRMLSQRRIFIEKKLAAIKIQSFIRMAIAKSDYEHKKAKIVKVQSFFRMQLKRSKFLKSVDRIILLQSLARRFTARTEFSKKRSAATKIQSAFRSFVVRTKYQQSVSVVTNMQALARGFLQRKKVGRQIANFTGLQSMIRGALVRSRNVSFKSRIIVAQSVVRGFLAKKSYQKLSHMIVSIQANARRFLQQKKYLRMKAVVIDAQALIRGSLIRRNFTKTIQSITQLQNNIRRYLSQSAYKRILNQVVYCQALSRGLLERKRYNQQVAKLRILQTHIRTFLVKRKAEAVRKRVVFIQRQFRRKLAERKASAEHTKLLVTNVQACARGYLERRRLEKKQIAIRTLQKAFRAQLESIRQRKVIEAATKIQSVYRSYIVRKNYKHLKEIRRRLQEAYAKAEESMKLGNRMKAAIDVLLNSKHLSDCNRACKHILVVTTLSQEMALKLLRSKEFDDFFGKLVKQIYDCNKSTPQFELVKNSIEVIHSLLHAAKVYENKKSRSPTPSEDDVPEQLISFSTPKCEELITKYQLYPLFIHLLYEYKDLSNQNSIHLYSYVLNKLISSFDFSACYSKLTSVQKKKLQLVLFSVQKKKNIDAKWIETLQKQNQI
ncbi:hypothetical protein MP638_000287 [Amoeboaphelidium occidentale]|nr:hypothetical protein MP638_000287 [Amoeboaphelidium occidentale]